MSVLRRGDIHFPMKTASPGALGCLPELEARFKLAKNADESARRARLARWIIDPRNPLTWRSIVNRAWQQHFGRGLVSTPNDFGRMGALPSHPELLDWLAIDVPGIGRLAQAARSADRDRAPLTGSAPPATRASPPRMPTTNGSGGRIGAGSMPNRFTTRSFRSPGGST